MDAPTARTPRSRPSHVSPSGGGERRPPRAGGQGARALITNTLWRTAPCFLAAVIALAGAAHLLPAPPIAVPLRMIVVIAVLLLGIGATFVFDRASARPYWQLVLAVVLVEMPVVALQSSALRAPFVALGRGSAGPLVWMTIASILVLLGLWIFGLLQQRDPAENAALLLLLPALIVPAMLGAGSELDESASLAMFAESAFVAGAATFVALLGPAGWRPLIAIAAFVLQVVVLWLVGKGPVVGPEAGFVSYLSLTLVLVTALGMMIMAPVGALFTRRFLQTVDEKTGIATPANVPQRGARRRRDT